MAGVLRAYNGSTWDVVTSRSVPTGRLRLYTADNEWTPVPYLGITTVAQDSFTESGSGTLALSSHTAEVGGTWSAKLLSSSTDLFIDRDGDTLTSGTATGSNYSAIGSVVVSDGDLYITNAPSAQASVVRYPSVLARQSGTTFYVFYAGDNGIGTVQNRLSRYTNGAATILGSGSAVGTGNDIRLHLQVSGSSPTSLRARWWNIGDAEPETWDIDTTDNTTENQMASGGVGVGSGNTSGTVSAGDDFLVTTGDGSGRLLVWSEDDTWLYIEPTE